jgi:membrane protein YqaA with SNARE-associated domain
MSGETVWFAAAIFAASGTLKIYWVIGAAAAGAIIGDNCGYWIGRELGFPLIYRFGHYIRLDEKRLKVGQYLFLRHGGKIIFFGRFVAVLRAFAAFLAGVNRYNWEEFFLYNAAGGFVWATIFGAGGSCSAALLSFMHGPRDRRADHRGNLRGSRRRFIRSHERAGGRGRAGFRPAWPRRLSGALLTPRELPEAESTKGAEMPASDHVIPHCPPFFWASG